MSLGTTVEYRYIRLKPADNGFILTYDEIIEKPGTMENRDHREREVVFGDSDEELDKALAKMKFMYMFNKTKNGDTVITASPLIAEAKTS